MPVYSGDRSTFSNFLKLFQTWTMAYYAGNAFLVSSESIFVVGKERAELDSVHGRGKVNQYIAGWAGVVKGIKKIRLF